MVNHVAPAIPRPVTDSFGAILMVAILALGAMSVNVPNAILAWASIAVLAVGSAMLWRPGEPPVLLYLFGLQWLQASIAIFVANWRSIPLANLYQGSGYYVEATWLSLCALTAMAIGMRFAAGAPRDSEAWSIQTTLQSRSLLKWFQLYLMFAAIGSLAQAGASAFPGLSQILGGVAALHWAFFLLLAGAYFAQRRYFSIWFYIAFLVELALSVGGYFSDFKTVFVVTALALIMTSFKLSIRTALPAFAVGIGVLYLAIMWTAIKSDYRTFANGGTRQQIVTQDYDERIAKIVELGSAVESDRFWAAGDAMLGRLSYVEFFGDTLSYVPRAVPHENGALLLDAVVRPFTPRLIFPEKTAIDDSVRTRKYTGRMVSGSESGTSISLGWIAELYIDFGRWIMMPFAVLVGWFYGWMHKFLMRGKWSSGALGAAVSTAILLSAAYLETSITKVTGGLVASLLAAWIVIRVFVPALAPWLSRPKIYTQQRNDTLSRSAI